MAFSNVTISRPVSVVIPVISSIAGTIRQYILSVLPKDYIRDYFIDTELPFYRNMNRRKFRPMSRSQLAVRKLPLMAIKVETTADPSDFGTGTTFWTSTKFLGDPTELTRLIADDHNLRYVGFETERMIVRFTVSFTVETDLRASELMMYLRRTLPVGSRFYLNDLDISTEIPKDILRVIWTDMGLGDNSDSRDMEEFVGYLKRVTGGNVTPVINSASGRTVFAFDYRSNILVNIPSPPSMNVTREENIVKSAQVDLQFEVDLEVPVAYAYRQEESLGGPVNGSTPFDLVEDGGNAYFSAAIRVRPPENIEGEQQLIFFTSIITGDFNSNDPTAIDSTDLSSAISNRLKTYISLLVSKNMLDKVTAKVWLDGNDVSDDGWAFDPDTWELDIQQPVLQPRQKYHFGVYADISMLDDLVPENRRLQPDSPML